MRTFDSLKYWKIRVELANGQFFIIVGDIQYNDFSMLPEDLEEDIVSELVKYRQELGL